MEPPVLPGETSEFSEPCGEAAKLTMSGQIITPGELRARLNRRRHEGERIGDKRAIRRAAEEIERLLAVIDDIAAKATAAGPDAEKD
jgi:RNA polymerase-interacting CarD/CdnL/TRCF family regulator